MALPNIQTAQYGDKVAVEKLGASRLQTNPAATVNGFKNMEGGRPGESDPVQLAIRAIKSGGHSSPTPNGPQGAGGVPLTPTELQHEQQLHSLAEMYATALKFVKIAAQPGAGPYTKAYALHVMKTVALAWQKTRGETPFIDGL